MICLLVTPVLYVLTLTFLENYFNRSYTEQIENRLIGDSKPLLEGQVRLEERIATNIDTFIQNDQLISLFKLKVKIQVISASGKIIYPLFQDVTALEKNFGQDFDRNRVAKANFDLLNTGFNVIVESNFGHGSRVANTVLFVYFGAAALVFIFFYLIGYKKAAKDREQKSKIISDLKKGEKSYKKALNQLSQERQDLFENIKALDIKYQESRQKSKLNEDELFDEIITLEEQIKSFIELKQSSEQEISELKSQVKKFERRRSSKNKRNEFDFCDKRFKALYKNIIMNRKAISGFLSLNDDQQIKAEEMIVQIDREVDKVVIKRKVFVGKKHKSPSFEVLFAYNGRLYFRKVKNNRVEVLVIGTKNTQQKDMEFLHGL